MFVTDINLTKWFIAVGVLVALLFLLAWGLKYVSNYKNLNPRGRKKRRLKLTETLHLDARNRLSIVEFDKIEFLLTVGPNGIESIGMQEKTETVDEENPAYDESDHVEGIGFLKPFVKGIGSPEDKEKNVDNRKDKPKKAKKKIKK